MIKRDKYLQQLINARENGFPKVITGIRRCGKSYLLREIYSKYLRADRVKKDHIIIMDLDEDRYSKYRDPVELGEYIRSLCADRGMYYIFLDEIQRVFTIINPVLTGGKHVIAGKEDMEKKTNNPQSSKTNSRARPRLILLREFSGYSDMRSVIEQAIEALILEKYDEMLLQKAS